MADATLTPSSAAAVAAAPDTLPPASAAPTAVPSAADAASHDNTRAAPVKRFVPLLERRWAIEVRQQLSWPMQALVLALSIALGLFICGTILVAAGVPPADLLNEFIMQTLFDAQNLRAVLFQAAPMIMVGLAAATAFRARFWNLGLEGQMIFGAIGATFISMQAIGPEGLRVWLMALAAMVCGLLWVVLPALLKFRIRINEVIATLMLNYVAVNFLLHLLYGSWKDPKDAFPYSPRFADFERLPDLADGLSSAILLAMVVAVGVWWLVEQSRAGLYLRFVNANERVAHAVGVPVQRVVWGSVLLSAALAGLAGFMVAAGQEGRLTQAFYVGYGFSGILIAFLARNNPLAASAVAVAVATLFITGRNLQVFYQIPFSMVQLIQAILVVCVASSEFFIRHRIRAVA